MEYNLPHVPEEFCDIVEGLGESIDRNRRLQLDAYKAVRAVRELGNSVRIPKTLDATAAEREAIPVLAEQALEDGSLRQSRLTDKDDMKRILERAFDGVFESRV